MTTSIKTSSVTVQQILYATDFSPTADKAEAYAAALAQHFGAALTLSHVFPRSADERSEADWQLDFEERRARLAERAQALTATGVSARVSLSSECPVPLALEMMQRRSGADLIVVGTEAKGLFDRFLLGSTAEALIRECHVPIITIGPQVTRLASSSPLFRKIVLATDFSRSSKQAEELAMSFSSEFGSHLYVCHVVRGAEIGRVDTTWAAESDFRNMLASSLPRSDYEWRAVESSGGHNFAADEIINLARNVHADLIVMGARERTFWLLHLSKGVTQDVVAQAPCPVLTAH